MRFGNLYFLAMLWIVPALVVFYVWSFRHKRQLVQKFVSDELRERLLKGVSYSRQYFKAGLLVLVCLMSILALIRPKWGFQWEEVHRRGVDLLVALDVSQSMMAKDVEPNRLERAKREILDLLRIIEGDRVGLVAFAGTAFLQCPLTLDHGAVQLFLDSLSPDLIPVPGTAIGEAIDNSVQAFGGDKNKSRALILITDGEDHEGDPIEAAKKAQAAGIRIYAIGIGKEGGAPIPNQEGAGFKKNQQGELILTTLDETTLQKIALETGGSYVRSVSGDLDLEKIYEDIRSSLEDQELESGRRKRFEERYQWPLMLALMLLLLEVIFPERRGAWLTWRKGAPLLLLFWASVGSASPAREGESLYEAEKYDEALTKLLDAQIEDPHNVELKYNLASTYYKLGRYEEAEKLYQAVLSSGDSSLAQRAQYDLGNTAFRQGKLNEALNHFQQAAEMDPKDEDAKYNLEFTRKEIKRRIEEQKKTQEKQQQQQQQKQQGDKKQNDNSDQKQEQGKQENQKPEDQSNSQQNDQQNAQPQPKDDQSSQQGEGQKGGEQEKKDNEEGAAGRAEAKPLSEKEAKRWLETLKEDRGKFQKKRMQGGRRYRVEKDW